MPLKTNEKQANFQALGVPLAVTVFPDQYASEKSDTEMSLTELADWIKTQHAAKKTELPYIKLAKFGTKRRPGNSGKGRCLRWGENVETVTGVEVDYDGGTIPPEDMVAAMEAAGVAGMVATTPSHGKPGKGHRWRGYAPFSGPMPPAAREEYVAKLNGLVGGALARESFTLPQAFYAGNEDGGTPVQTWLVDGLPIDRVEGLKPIYKDGASKKRKPTTLPDTERPPLSHVADVIQAIPGDPEKNPDAAGYLYWLKIGMALHHATGGSEDGRDLWHGWSEQNEAEYKFGQTDSKWDSFGGGGGDPVTIATLESEARKFGWVDISSLADQISAEEQAEIDALVGMPTPAEGPDWGKVIVERGKPVNNLNNAVVYLRRNLDSILPGLRLNQMTGREEWHDGPLNDAALALARTGLERRNLKTVGKELVADAAMMVARHLQYHPIRDYLTGLDHDGRERLDSWLVRHAEVEDSPYTRAVGRKFLLQMVARVMRPGCKADHTLVLAGPQGAGKSTLCRTLAGEEYFSDTLPSITGDKTEALRHLPGKWLVEMAEMAPSRKSDAEDLKAFMSGTVDRVRRPWGRFDEAFPRQCVFVGTTNEDQFLRDATGGRRFWPVYVGQIDPDYLAAERDQLFAEAFLAFMAGEPWWLDRDFEAEHAKPVQDAARESDAWAEDVAAWLDRPDDDFDGGSSVKTEVRTSEVLSGALGVPSGQQTMALQKRAGDVMRALGWMKIHTRGGNKWARAVA